MDEYRRHFIARNPRQVGGGRPARPRGIRIRVGDRRKQRSEFRLEQEHLLPALTNFPQELWATGAYLFRRSLRVEDLLKQFPNPRFVGHALPPGRQHPISHTAPCRGPRPTQDQVLFHPVASLTLCGLKIPRLLNDSLTLIGIGADGVALFLTGLILSSQPFRMNRNVALGTVPKSVVPPLFAAAL